MALRSIYGFSLSKVNFKKLREAIASGSFYSFSLSVVFIVFVRKTTGGHYLQDGFR